GGRPPRARRGRRARPAGRDGEASWWVSLLQDGFFSRRLSEWQRTRRVVRPTRQGRPDRKGPEDRERESRKGRREAERVAEAGRGTVGRRARPPNDRPRYEVGKLDDDRGRRRGQAREGHEDRAPQRRGGKRLGRDEEQKEHEEDGSRNELPVQNQHRAQCP